ncbi:MAG: hypothetical protein ACOYOU_01550 [Kiritimatiellia bacterium]
MSEIPSMIRGKSGAVRRIFQWLQRWRTSLVAWTLVLLAVGFVVWSWAYLQPRSWKYYTDETSLRRQARRAQPQPVVWEAAGRMDATFAVPLTNAAHAAISPDQQQLIFVQPGTNGSLDLFLSHRLNFGWGPAEPIRALNSPFNETDPAFSRDGKFLYFASDRPGGPGGYDIWVARWDGETFAWPLPLTFTVNSKFNDKAPAPAPDRTLYFASDRPRNLRDEERSEPAATLAVRYPVRDFDIFYADAVPAGVTNVESERAQSILYSLRERVLSETNVMHALGGTVESETAVDRALAWLAGIQEKTNGMWSSTKYEGAAGHNVAATAFSLLAFYGRSQRHDRPCQYQDTVRRGLGWLLSQQNDLTGDLRGPSGNSMYDHCIGTLALAEAYGLTKDELLRPAVQSAVFFLVDAQHPTMGGWRYAPLEAPDLSVSGWGIMALKSAELSGIHVQLRTFDLIKTFLKSVSSGTSGGNFTYQPKNPGNPSKAMIATGFFCSQIMGLSPNSRQAFEAVALAGTNGCMGDIYFLYYGTLSGYQFQGKHWRSWRNSIHRELLDMQDEDGSWPPSAGHAKAGGKIMSTALIALSLQAHYRYTPLYGLGYEPPSRPSSGTILSLDELPEMPNYYSAARFSRLVNTFESDEIDPAMSPHGDYLYFSSNRKSSFGGFDLYRTRIATRIPTPCENLGPEINSAGDEVGAGTWMEGFGLLFNRRLESGTGPYEWYGSMSRRVWPHYDYSKNPKWSWLMSRYALPLMLAGATLLAFLVSILIAVRHWKKRSPKR